MLMNRKDKCLSLHPDFSFDEACLNIYNKLNDNITIFGQYLECDGCDFQPLGELLPSQNKSILISTKYSLSMFYNHKNGEMCSWKQELLEHYRYGWNLTDHCGSLYIMEEADNAYIPIFTAYIIFMFIGTLWYMIKCIYKCTRDNILWRRLMFNSSEIETDLGTTGESQLVNERAPMKKNSSRMKSLDVFRGFCILLMIFVNYGGGQYWFFKHVAWNGMTFADLLFPWFNWIMGFSMHLSFNTRLRRAIPRRQLISQVIKRSIILILLGLALNSHGRALPLSTLRFLGVFQRLGLCYLIVGLLESILSKRSFNRETRLFKWIPEIIYAWPQWIIMLLLVAIHTLITFLVNVPGCGRGYLGPGGLHDHGKYQNCTGGVAGYIDRVVLGKHIFSGGTQKKIYETTVSFDPEGLLGTLTGAFLVFLGVHAARIMSVHSTTKDRFWRMIGYGILECLIGALLCNFSKNGGWIPVNKNLWSLSFVLVLSGFASIIFATLHVLVDVLRKWGGRPLFYAGMNPLVLYVCHILFQHTFPFAWVPDTQTHAQYLFMNLWGTIIWLCFSIYLYKNDIFISL